jgi:hypothetical protein
MTSPEKKSPPLVRATAWSLFALFLGVGVAGSWLVLAGSDKGEAAVPVMALGFAVVGTLVAIREPRNSVGWLMLLLAIALNFTTLLEGYLAAPARPGEVPVAWISSWIWHAWLTLAFLILPLVFPNGRLLSRRWRSAMWLAITSMALSMASDAFRSGPLDVRSGAKIQNPLGVGGGGAPLIEALGVAGNVLSLFAIVIGVASLVLRLRRSHGREHQQLKWFAFVGALGLGALALSSVGAFAERFGSGRPPAWVEIVGGIGWFSAILLTLVGLPVAIGTSMLRHRLYDIDLVIKRTLVYGALTLLLVSVYLGLVLALRSLLNQLTGDSDLAVAASTLAVAALFRPLRTRIQNLVDRRFYRARYDATQAADAFTAQLRQEVDLDAVTTDLLDVVRDTLQPKHATLWLRGTSQGGR